MTATDDTTAADLGDDSRIFLRDGTSAVLRLSEAEANALEYEDVDDHRMIINMGPQHPSTHGVLRPGFSTSTGRWVSTWAAQIAPRLSHRSVRVP